MMKNEYQVTWERYCSWCVESMLHGVQLVLRIWWIVLVVGFLFIIMLSDAWIHKLMLVYCIYQAFFCKLVQGKAQYKKQAEYYGKEGWKRRIILDEENIGLSEGRLLLTYDYKDITKVRDKNNKIWLYFQDGTVLRMYKDAFTQGSWEECNQLLEKRMVKKNKKFVTFF